MSAPHDAPSAAELIEAVREFLESDAAGGADGRSRFLLRVAVNVLDMVERELRLGASQAADHESRLRRLGAGDDASLARAVRNGDFDARTDELFDALRDTVRAKLEVANPGYMRLGAGSDPTPRDGWGCNM